MLLLHGGWFHVELVSVRNKFPYGFSFQMKSLSAWKLCPEQYKYNPRHIDWQVFSLQNPIDEGILVQKIMVLAHTWPQIKPIVRKQSLYYSLTQMAQFNVVGVWLGHSLGRVNLKCDPKIVLFLNVEVFVLCPPSVCPLLTLETAVFRISCWFLIIYLVKMFIYLPWIHYTEGVRCLCP